MALLSSNRHRAESGGDRPGARRPWEAEPSERIRTIIESVATAYGVPVAFAMADAAHESRFKSGVGLNTLSGGEPDGAIPERSVGLMGVNVNPNTPTGQRRIAHIQAIADVDTDAEVIAKLKEPEFNVGYWCAHIVRELIRRADSEGRTGREKWIAVRVWLFSPRLNPDNMDNRWVKKTRTEFVRTLDKWETVYG